MHTPLTSGNFINEFEIKHQLEASDGEPYHLVMVHGYGAGLGFYLKNFDALLARRRWIIHAIDLLGYGCLSRPKFSPNNLDDVEAWFHNLYSEWAAKRGINPDRTIVLAHSMGAYLMASYGIRTGLRFCRKMLMVSPGAVIRHRRQVAVPDYFARLWEQNISPFSLVRKAGPLGLKLVSMWLSRRFAHLPEKEKALFHRYSYGIFQAPGSGEYMLNYLLAPGADARHPLAERGISNLQCNTLWWYGSSDWMDPEGGRICSDIINQGGSFSSDVRIVPHAGHHIYLDNPRAFNRMVLDEMKLCERIDNGA